MKTTNDEGHEHEVFVDCGGWGETDYAYDKRDRRHKHDVNAWQVVSAAGHEHEVDEGS